MCYTCKKKAEARQSYVWRAALQQITLCGSMPSAMQKAARRPRAQKSTAVTSQKLQPGHEADGMTNKDTTMPGQDADA